MKKIKKITFWVATLWLSTGMVSTGIVQLLKLQDHGKNLAPGGITSMQHLGYPLYLLSFLGVGKILGTIVILLPKLPILKEWAYAGFFFIMTGAVYSHLYVGDQMKELFPALLLLALTGVSWFLRPEARKAPAT